MPGYSPSHLRRRLGSAIVNPEEKRTGVVKPPELRIVFTEVWERVKVR
jgi:hypothetical protein